MLSAPLRFQSVLSHPDLVLWVYAVLAFSLFSTAVLVFVWENHFYFLLLIHSSTSLTPLPATCRQFFFFLGQRFLSVMVSFDQGVILDRSLSSPLRPLFTLVDSFSSLFTSGPRGSSCSPLLVGWLRTARMAIFYVKLSIPLFCGHPDRISFSLHEKVTFWSRWVVLTVLTSHFPM